MRGDPEVIAVHRLSGLLEAVSDGAVGGVDRASSAKTSMAPRIVSSWVVRGGGFPWRLKARSSTRQERQPLSNRLRHCGHTPESGCRRLKMMMRLITGERAVRWLFPEPVIFEAEQGGGQTGRTANMCARRSLVSRVGQTKPNLSAPKQPIRKRIERQIRALLLSFRKPCCALKSQPNCSVRLRAVSVGWQRRRPEFVRPSTVSGDQPDLGHEGLDTRER